VTPVFGRLYVVPRLREFFARYPGLAVELVVTDRVVNLVEEGLVLAEIFADEPGLAAS
jgi:DNA-binding transcriptional LysR family regulator